MPTPALEPLRFAHRRDAGRRLASALQRYAARPEVLVLGLPRGGVPVAFEVARALHAPLDVVVVRKLGTPGHAELAMGAVAKGVLVREEGVIVRQHIADEVVKAAAEREEAEVIRREQRFRGDRPPLQLSGRTVILVDDGIATGATMRAAVRAVRALQPARLVVAVPVAAPELVAELAGEVDEMVALLQPANLVAVGLWYDDFGQTEDDEVARLLAAARAATT
jgi:putative phosphoribosyl transferase